MTDQAVTYASYLKSTSCSRAAAALARGREHDELLFIVIHQVYELWFKELLHELDRVRQWLEDDEPHRAQHTLKRILSILKVMVAQLDILETMTPLEFRTFRSGSRPRAVFSPTSSARSSSCSASSRRPRFAASGREARAGRAGAALSSRRCGTRSCTTCRAKATRCRHRISNGRSAPIEPSADVQRILLAVYREDPKNAELCERLVDLDEGVQEWRYRHVKMVERTIGAKRGTAVPPVRLTCGKPSGGRSSRTSGKSGRSCRSRIKRRQVSADRPVRMTRGQLRAGDFAMASGLQGPLDAQDRPGRRFPWTRRGATLSQSRRPMAVSRCFRSSCPGHVARIGEPSRVSRSAGRKAGIEIDPAFLAADGLESSEEKSIRVAPTFAFAKATADHRSFSEGGQPEGCGRTL